MHSKDSSPGPPIKNGIGIGPDRLISQKGFGNNALKAYLFGPTYSYSSLHQRREYILFYFILLLKQV